GEQSLFFAADVCVAPLERVAHGCWNGLAIERALQQPLESFADEIANAGRAQLMQPMLPPRVIHRLGQRRIRIDERAVQIEQHGAISEGGSHERRILSTFASTDSASAATSKRAHP